MRVLIVGGPEPASLREELDASGVASQHRADGARPGDGPEEIAEIARDLREFERALEDPGADAVLLASDSPAALAAVLVATKAGVPVARLGAGGGTTEETANAPLIRQLADAALAPEAAAVLAWARDGYPARA